MGLVCVKIFLGEPLYKFGAPLNKFERTNPWIQVTDFLGCIFNLNIFASFAELVLCDFLICRMPYALCALASALISKLQGQKRATYANL